MNREDYRQAKEIFQTALDTAPENRAAYLEQVCAGNEALRGEVERLLESFDSQFLERPAVAQMAEIVVKEDYANDPTMISFENEPPETDIEETPDENALRPSRQRFALVCLLFAVLFIFVGINISQSFLIQSSPPFDYALQGGGVVITNVRQGFEEGFQVGDELVGVNEIEANFANLRRLETLGFEKPGERQTFTVRRGGQTRRIETISVPPPLSLRLRLIFVEMLFPAMFLITGLLLFLFKPNDKQALLMALILGSSLDSGSLSALADLPAPLFVLKIIGLLMITLSAPLFLYLLLIFPERSTLLRRFPKLELLIFTPYLLLVPSRLLVALQYAGYSVLINPALTLLLQKIGLFSYRLYHLAALLMLIFIYRQSGEIARRKLRVGIAGFLCAFSLALLIEIILNPVLRVFDIQNPWEEWMPVVIVIPMLLIPPVVAHAIVRHRVIPVSFVFRRGLQYLFAKNALRLLLIMPILGIVWNIAVNPNRTIYEIIFQNSFAFYSSVALAAGCGLLLRSRLNEWIDRRFFREQYNQERMLRELTEAVKQSDSITKLSRLVSSKIQLALHPESLYLFYRDDDRNSDFSLGFSTGGGNGNSENLILAADSPLLRFMQKERGIIEFPTRQTDDLPNREKRWLRETGANLLVPMHASDGRLAGIFTLGEKMSQIPYTTRDKELLETLANQIALVHENLNLKDRVRRDQKVRNEILSRFDESNINLLKECPNCGRCFDRNNENCSDDGAELIFSLPVERTIENRYQLEKLLGKGGMGAVYEATDLRINRQVAVKILSGAMFGNRDALRRFEREAQTAGKLNHRNIVTVFDYGVLSTEGAFLVMELVESETLSEVLKRKRKLNAETVIAWFSQVLDGVDAAHRAGIVHRDLKPDNIFVTCSGEDEKSGLRILDFGLARFSEPEFADCVTAPGIVMGTPGYMPPEQLRGEKVDERSDLFAIGVMIYECLHGEKPFTGKTYRKLTQSMNKEIVFDSAFGELFRHSLAREPEKRFATASEMKKSLTDQNFA